MIKGKQKPIKLPCYYHRLSPTEKREVREQYTKTQKGFCMYCGEPLTSPPADTVQKKKVKWAFFPKGFLDYPIHLQHSHKSGLTEGAVHAYCNAVLWQYHGR